MRPYIHSFICYFLPPSLTSQLRRQGVEFRVRAITEVQRSITDRDAYERESRRIRYDFYAACMAEFPAVRGICVGHHSGDVAENVVTNLMKGICLLGIAGMAETSIVNGVPVWCVRARCALFGCGSQHATVRHRRRPLLSFDKSAIFAFAHTFGVPYFKCDYCVGAVCVHNAELTRSPTAASAEIPRPTGRRAASCDGSCCLLWRRCSATVRAGNISPCRCERCFIRQPCSPASPTGILRTLSNAGADADALAEMVHSTLLRPFQEAVRA